MKVRVIIQTEAGKELERFVVLAWDRSCDEAEFASEVREHLFTLFEEGDDE